MSVDLKHLQKIEAGTINVTLGTLVRIAEGLDVGLRTLFLDVGEKEAGRAKRASKAHKKSP